MKLTLITGAAIAAAGAVAMAADPAPIQGHGADASVNAFAAVDAPGGAEASRTAGVAIRRELVVNGLSRPLFVTHAPNDTSRIFIVEQRDGSTGRIRIVDLANDLLLPLPFLSVPDVSTGSEQGLLGLAFHPDYDTNGHFYINFTDASEATVVRRYTVSANPNVAEASSAQTVLTFSQPHQGHNGGWLGFGPDGYLYIGAGDGGPGGDPQNRAQNVDSLFGKMLRVDVNGDDFPGDPDRNYAIPASNPFVGVAGLDEIWALGLRNPWRNSFDRETGDLFIADVGQGRWEELNFQPASSPGGENYGWRCYEGDVVFTAGQCDPADLVFPIHVYPIFGLSTCSITGGYVYRGAAMPELHGAYFFADYCTGDVWTLEYDGSTVSNFVSRTSQITPAGENVRRWISSFGQDAHGELYICYLMQGEVHRIVPSVDCPADLTGSGAVGAADLAILLGNWGADGGPADLDNDGAVGSADLAELLGNWGPCP